MYHGQSGQPNVSAFSTTQRDELRDVLTENNNKLCLFLKQANALQQSQPKVLLELPKDFQKLTANSQWLIYKPAIEDICSQPPYLCWEYVSGAMQPSNPLFDVKVCARARRLLLASVGQEYQQQLVGTPKTFDNSIFNPNYTPALIIENSRVFRDGDPYPDRQVLPSVLWIRLQEYVVTKAETNRDGYINTLNKTLKKEYHTVGDLVHRVDSLVKVIGGEFITPIEKTRKFIALLEKDKQWRDFVATTRPNLVLHEERCRKNGSDLYLEIVKQAGDYEDNYITKDRPENWKKKAFRATGRSGAFNCQVVPWDDPSWEPDASTFDDYVAYVADLDDESAMVAGKSKGKNYPSCPSGCCWFCDKPGHVNLT